ncbi:endonuclease exonuclease phosphatase family protein [Cystoisospora suis]|uniref:Endonuclease exonuclease phosphatase family protein n=1 Tax=Cystoisospora suis TaxID=483139 RepID=A0A2C6KLS5_9APIC|nr:endonuclease exonuclease phosphatase family protein [Cystoisospora suis]
MRVSSYPPSWVSRSSPSLLPSSLFSQRDNSMRPSLLLVTSSSLSSSLCQVNHYLLSPLRKPSLCPLMLPAASHSSSSRVFFHPSLLSSFCSLSSSSPSYLFSPSSPLSSSASSQSAPVRLDHPPGTASPYIRILTYNILNRNDSWRGGRFFYCDPSNLQLSMRLPRISHELLHLSPDISCLQEVDSFSLRFLVKELKTQDYASAVFSAIPSRGGTGGYGCAILYSTKVLLSDKTRKLSRTTDVSPAWGRLR